MAANTGRIVYLSEVPTDAPPQLFADQPDVLDVAGVARLLGVAPKTVYREVAKGRMECVHVGSRVRITKPQLLSYLEVNA